MLVAAAVHLMVLVRLAVQVAVVMVELRQEPQVVLEQPIQVAAVAVATGVMPLVVLVVQEL
jgi:hypothetical protein